MEEALENTHTAPSIEKFTTFEITEHRWGDEEDRKADLSSGQSLCSGKWWIGGSGVPGTRTKNESWVWKRPKRGQGSVSHQAEQVEERWLKKVSQLEKSVKEPENEMRMVTTKREATQKHICWSSSCLKWRIKSCSRAKISWEVLCDTKVFPRGISCDGVPREDNLEAGIIK